MSTLNIIFTHSQYKTIEAIAAAAKAISNKEPLTVYVQSTHIVLQMIENKKARSFYHARINIDNALQFEANDWENVVFDIKYSDMFSKVSKMNVNWLFELNNKDQITFKCSQGDAEDTKREYHSTLTFRTTPLKSVSVSNPFNTLTVPTTDFLEELKSLEAFVIKLQVTSYGLSLKTCTESVYKFVSMKALLETPVIRESIEVEIDIEYLIKVLMKLKTKFKTTTIVFPTNPRDLVCCSFGDDVKYYLVTKE